MTKPKALIFDWDDTVVDTYQSILKLHQSFAKRYGKYDFKEEDLRLLWGDPIQKIMGALWPNQNTQAVLKDFYDYVAEIDSCVKPFDFAHDILASLKAQKYILGVVSSSPRFGLEKTMQRFMSLPLDTFLAIHTADDDEFHKPDPQVFNKIFVKLSELSISEADTLYIGDSTRDFQAAKERGIQFVGVLTGFTTKDDFIKAGLEEELILGSIQELPNLSKIRS